MGELHLQDFSAAAAAAEAIYTFLGQ